MSILFPKNDPEQTLRLQRFFMAAASYGICIGLLYYFFFQGQFSLSLGPSLALTLFCAVYNIAVFIVLRTGINKRFADPSLTLLQIMVALGLLLGVTFYTDMHRTILIPFYLVIFVFGVFQLKVRDFLLMTLLTLTGYGFIILMLYYHRPERMVLPLEIMNWIILATVLPWFSIVGGYISNLRATISSINTELKTSMLRYKSLFENMLDMVLVLDTEHRILIANPLFYATTGISPEKTVAACHAFIHPEDLDRMEKELLAELPGQEMVTDFQFRIKDKDGHALHVECNARCIKNDDQILGMQLMLRDITQRRQLEDQLRHSYDNLKNTREVTIMGLAKLAEYRDKSTGGHLERIREYSRALTRQVARLPEYSDYITDEYIETLYLSSILHDIGKVAIPDAILLKPARLDPDEFEIIKQHASLGGDAIKEAEAQIQGKSFLTMGKEIAYYHHEKWNGQGYPAGLAGKGIPLSARIVALVDVYDALTTDRVYKKAYPHDRARTILLNDRGIHFDPDIVDAFFAIEDTFKTIAETYRDRASIKPWLS